MSAFAAPAVLDADAETTRLFEAHSTEILAFCRRQLPSPGDAEDALQTTFLYALRALRRGVLPENEAAWLTAIAKNVCRTQRRTLGRRGAHTADLDIDRIALARPEPEEVELLAELPEALASLPENQRNALVMREWQGLGHDEIASRLELTTTATSALLTRARHSLAAALTATGRTRSVLDAGLLLGGLRAYVRSLLGGAASKAAVGAAVASVAVGGVVVERSLEPGPAKPRSSPRPVMTASPARTHSAPGTTRVPRASSRPMVSRGPIVRDSATPTAERPTAVSSASTAGARGTPTPALATPGPSAPAPAAEPATMEPAPRDATRDSSLPETPDPGDALPIPGVDLPPLPPPPLPPLPQVPPAPDVSAQLPVEVPTVPPLPPPLPPLP